MLRRITVVIYIYLPEAAAFDGVVVSTAFLTLSFIPTFFARLGCLLLLHGLLSAAVLTLAFLPTFLARLGCLLLLHGLLSGFRAKDDVDALHVIRTLGFLLVNLGPVEEEYLPPFLN